MKVMYVCYPYILEPGTCLWVPVFMLVWALWPCLQNILLISDCYLYFMKVLKVVGSALGLFDVDFREGSCYVMILIYKPYF